MRLPLDEGDQEFLRLLQARGDATVQDLCEAAGVTATAVRQRLTRLQDLNLVARVTIRSGRGRPHHRYQLTDAGRQAFGDNYGELAVLLWEELQRIEDVNVRRNVLVRIREQFVRRMGASVNGQTLEQRLTQLKASLGDRGFRVDVQAADKTQPVLREHHCPYHELAALNDGVCELEQQVFEDILGVPLELVQSCREGANCCEFRLAASEEHGAN